MKNQKLRTGHGPGGAARSGDVWPLPLLCAALCLLALLAALDGAESGFFYSRVSGPYEEITAFSTVEEPLGDGTGRPSAYRFTIPDIDLWGEHMAVYLSHAYAEVWIDGVPVCRSEAPDRPLPGRSPGNYWLFIPLSEADEGKDVLLRVTPVYPDAAPDAPLVAISTQLNIVSARVHRDLPELALSTFCLITGLIYMFFSLSQNLGQREKPHFFYLGAFTAAYGLCCMFRLPLLSMLSGGGSRAWYVVSMAGALLTPVLFTRFLLYSGEAEGQRRAFRTLCAFSEAVSGGIALSQLLRLRDLWENIRLLYVVEMGILCAAAALSVLKQTGGRHTRRDLRNELLFLCCGAAVTLDSAAPGRVSWMLCVCALHSLVVGAVSIHNALEQRQQLSRTRAELAEARADMMLSQIQPHFLYNALDSICYLCGTEPEQARQALRAFSRYLRNNLSSLNRKEPVPFSAEIGHVETYLMLEKMSMRDKLRYEFDCRDVDFLIPALTVQPLVENAVRHGIQETRRGGTVTVSAYETPDGYVVTVRDDGAGFDPENVDRDAGPHIGIENVRSRLASVCGGTLEIESAPGAGTTATITLPKGGAGI